LDQYICAGKVHDYYETVFTEMVTEGSLGFDSVSFDGKYWYEIDTLEDLEKAEKLFSAKKPVVVVSRKAKMCISEKIRQPLLKTTENIIKPLSDHKAKIIDAVKDKTLTNIKPFHDRLYRKKKELSLNTSTQKK
jgi:NDP-sugar pyrophosphorylase family protein